MRQRVSHDLEEGKLGTTGLGNGERIKGISGAIPAMHPSLFGYGESVLYAIAQQSANLGCRALLVLFGDSRQTFGAPAASAYL
jgi:hypothetical protein